MFEWHLNRLWSDRSHSTSPGIRRGLIVCNDPLRFDFQEVWASILLGTVNCHCFNCRLSLVMHTKELNN